MLILQKFQERSAPALQHAAASPNASPLQQLVSVQSPRHVAVRRDRQRLSIVNEVGLEQSDSRTSEVNKDT